MVLLVKPTATRCSTIILYTLAFKTKRAIPVRAPLKVNPL